MWGWQVWMQDQSGEWRPIASSFRDYFRLMIVHLGILGWQVGMCMCEEGWRDWSFLPLYDLRHTLHMIHC
jgi:hypothetical protein